MRATACLILLLASLLLFASGTLLHSSPVYPDDPNSTTAASNASEFALNRAVAAGRLFRDPAGLLRIRSSATCPT